MEEKVRREERRENETKIKKSQQSGSTKQSRLAVTCMLWWGEKRKKKWKMRTEYYFALTKAGGWYCNYRISIASISSINSLVYFVVV